MRRWYRQTVVLKTAVSCLISSLLLGCGQAKEEPVSPDSPQSSAAVATSDPVEAEAEPHSESSTLPLGSTPEEEMGSPRALHGSVLVAGDLGLTVSGMGAEDPQRSAKALEQQLLTFLPQLEDVYVQQLAQNPQAMGSLDVRMMIEPDGKVSEIRFPLKRVSNEKLTAALYDVMRAWQFAPAERAVDLRYRMLLVPASLDSTSISRWEQLLAQRSEPDRSEVPAPPVLPTAKGEVDEKQVVPAARAEAQKPVEPTVVARPSRSPEREMPRKEERQDSGTSQPPATRVPAQAPRNLVQWYEVSRPTTLFEAPLANAAVVAR